VKKKTKRISKKKNKAVNHDQALRDHLVSLLKGGEAHVHFMDAIEGFPEAKRGAFVEGFRHTGWQLLEHVRIAQWDILEFSRNPKHVSPKWPAGYWPPTEKPPSAGAWSSSIASLKKDLEAMAKLVESPKTDLYAKLPHGDGQNILREALLIADHNSYHLGQLMLLSRLVAV